MIIKELLGKKDSWEHRSELMTCRYCMFWLNFRCRRHSPGTEAIQGWPATFSADWCGDHKLDKKLMESLDKERR
jgi:hypothetical protein